MKACLFPRRQIREFTVKAVRSRQGAAANLDKCKLLNLREIGSKKKFAGDVNGRTLAGDYPEEIITSKRRGGTEHS
jgi:hypothetical protein